MAPGWSGSHVFWNGSHVESHVCTELFLELQRKMFCSFCSCRIVKSANILEMNHSRKVSYYLISIQIIPGTFNNLWTYLRLRKPKMYSSVSAI